MTVLTLAPVDGADDELHAALALAGMPTGDLTETGRSFYRLSEGARTVGFGGYELHGADALLRSLVIHPAARGHGLGAAATLALLKQMGAAGARHAYLLTDTAEAFFSRLGFARIDRAAAPTAIRSTRQAVQLCPASATLMTRAVEG